MVGFGRSDVEPVGSANTQSINYLPAQNATTGLTLHNEIPQNTSTATALFLSLIDAVCIFNSTNSTVLRNKDHQDCLSPSLNLFQ